jgi:hypothetical protein
MYGNPAHHLSLFSHKLKATLAALETDLGDLEESVKYATRPCSTSSRLCNDLWPRIVETTGARMFGLDDGEVIKRRRYVSHVRSELEVRGT